MVVIDNPVLHRELLTNLRTPRAFVLLFSYVALLGGMVCLAWPQEARLDLARHPDAGRRLVHLLFLGQYVLAAILAPSFAAGAIAGEKERRSYEMLIVSPLRPGQIVLGKLLASLGHLSVLIFCSLPIVLLCLPYGGVSLYEVLAIYLNLFLSLVLFGLISLVASCTMHRTAAAMVVSHLVILPLVCLAVLFWNCLASAGSLRLLLCVTVVPALYVTVSILLFTTACHCLLHAADVGAEGGEAGDLEADGAAAVGLVIDRGQFPDRLFAPAKRTDLMPNGVNPVYDKEMRSEMFSQGTGMLRLAIQISLGLAIPLMAIWLFIRPWQAPWYIGYVVLFSLLVGPVFSAGAVTSERERQTLDLLLTTTLSPWTILCGKLLSALRISGTLTLLLLWPLLLACVLPMGYGNQLPTVLGYLLIVLLACLTTSTTALFCSILTRKTSISLMSAYLILILLFAVPLAFLFFAETFFPEQAMMALARAATATSPLAAPFHLPLRFGLPGEVVRPGDGRLFLSHVAFAVGYNAALLSVLAWLLNVRWRVFR